MVLGMKVGPPLLAYAPLCDVRYYAAKQRTQCAVLAQRMLLQSDAVSGESAAGVAEGTGLSPYAPRTRCPVLTERMALPGTMRFANGDVYRGDFVNGTMHGMLLARTHPLGTDTLQIENLHRTYIATERTCIATELSYYSAMVLCMLQYSYTPLTFFRKSSMPPCDYDPMML
eukprot:1236476-Rhodomonas_salina.4